MNGRNVICIVFLFCFMGLKNESCVVTDLISYQDLQAVSGAAYGEKIVSGVVKIITSKADCAQVMPNNIIVAEMTKDEWLPAIKICAGIITDLGDSRCHAVKCGKKYNIPVLICTGNATKKLTTGDRIKLDCSQQLKGHVYTDYGAPVLHQAHVPSHHTIMTEHTTVSTWSAAISEAKENELSSVIHVTPQLFNQYQQAFERNILENKNEYWWGKRTGMIKKGAKWRGYDSYAIDTIPVADDFFVDLSERAIRSLIYTVATDEKYLSIIETILERSAAKPGDKNWVARMAYEEHIKALNFPDDVDKDMLIKDPTKYKKEYIDQNKIDKHERYKLTVAGMFACFWVENKCKG